MEGGNDNDKGKEGMYIKTVHGRSGGLREIVHMYKPRYTC